MKKKRETQGGSAIQPQQSINSLCWKGWVGMAILLVATLAMAYLLTWNQARLSSQAQAHALAAQLQARTEAFIQQQRSLLKMLSRDNEIKQLLLTGTAPQLAQKSQALEAYFENIRGFRLVKPEAINRIDETGALHIGYADLDLMQRTKTEAESIAEISKWGSEQQRIALAQKIPTGEDEHGIAGIILLGLNTQALSQLVDQLPIHAGYIELQQSVTLTKGKVENKVLALFGKGDSNAQRGEPDGVVPIEGSRWQVAYWQAHAGSALSLTIQLAWAGLTLIALVISAGLFFMLGHTITKTLRNDLVVVINVVKDILSQSMRREYPVALVNTKGVIDVLLHSAQELRKSMSAGASSKAANVANTTQDLSPTDLLFQGDNNLSVKEVTAVETSKQAVTVEIPSSIFRAYDIRGIVGQTLNASLAYEIGRAIGSEAYEQGQQALVVARDGRLSGAELLQALAKGIQATGCDVIDVGCVPTPALYFAAYHLETLSGVMVTGSHNPPDYNGFKILLNGNSLAETQVQALRHRLENNRLLAGQGSYQTRNIVPDYLDRILGDISLARDVKVVIDCGNGVASEIAPQLFRDLGCQVIELFCKTDGNFPNHHPNPSDPKNLQDLIQAVRQHQADIGLAFDGDGDRLGIISRSGNIIWPDRYLMLLAEDILSRNPGADILYDVKCSRYLAPYITKLGGRAMMWKTGHSLLKARMKETGALLGGEFSGHIFIAERWYGFDDALYAAARLLEILAADPMQREFEEIFADLPHGASTPELLVNLDNSRHAALLSQVELAAKAQFAEAEIITIDGVRIEWAEGWALIRGSNTMPVLTLRFEADHEAGLRNIQKQFRQLLQDIEPGLKLPF